MKWQYELIKLFLFIDKYFSLTISGYCIRTSNYVKLDFTDEEAITILLFCIIEKRSTVKEIYDHADRYMREWFPRLPKYEAFNHRINKLVDVFIPLIEKIQSFAPELFNERFYRIIDSMPIVMAQNGRRFKAKVAPDIADKNGYCVTKNLYFYGVRLHLIGSYNIGSMPIPEYIGISAAGVADCKVYEQIIQELSVRNLFGDKAYQKNNQALFVDNQVEVFTPVKKKKHQEFLDSADKLLSTAVSRIRQPIESLNNWLQEKTSIQTASKVRSSKGLLVHVFSKIAAAMYILICKNLSF